MKTDAIKLELFEWLAKTKDEGMLAAMLQLKKSAELPDWFDSFTTEQKAIVEQGIEDYKKGRTTKSKDVWKKYGRKG